MSEEEIASLARRKRHEAQRGLDVSGYSGKWRVAQRMALKDKRPLDYWQRARKLFLELGGRRTKKWEKLN